MKYNKYFVGLESPYLMDTLPDTGTRSQSEQQNPPSSDPLMAKGLQKEQYIGIGLLAVVMAIVVGLVSRKLEHAIAFSFVVSLILIVFGFLL